MSPPDFLIIGAMKAGTTALYEFLKQNRSLFMCDPKEPNFFALAGLTRAPKTPEMRSQTLNEHDYRELFSRARADQLCGEASHSTLYYEHAAYKLREFAPRARLIVILRDPVERAYSHYLFLRRDGIESEASFDTALELEEERVANDVHWGHYFRRGLYARQIRRFLDLFPREQLLALRHERLDVAPQEVVEAVCRFLGVPAHKIELGVRSQKSGIPRSRLLHRLLRSPSPKVTHLARAILPRPIFQSVRYLRNRNLERPSMPLGTRRMLQAKYESEIRDLQSILAQDFSSWLR